MGKLYIVATPIGNLNDISKRALETLDSCDIIAAEDTRTTIKLLNHYNIKTKMISYHKFNENSKKEFLLSQLTKEDKNIALVSDAGTPCISDPGYQLVKSAREQNINIVGISGASAVTIALSISGLDTSSFAFYGFLPTKKNMLVKKLTEITKNPVKTFIIYESPKRIANLLNEINNINPYIVICLCNDLTKHYEKVYFGNVEKVFIELKENENYEKGEYTLIGHIPENNKLENNTLEDISIEAKLINEIKRHNISLKEAVEIVSKKLNKPKKHIYSASLSLKNIAKDILNFADK